MLLTPFAADAEDEQTQNFVTSYKEAMARHRSSSQQTLMMRSTRSKQQAEQAGVTPDMSVAISAYACERL